LKRELEALLFATDAPLTVARLRKIFSEAAVKDLKDAVGELRAEYEAAGLAFTVVEFGGGWQIATRPEFAPVVEKLLRTRRVARLSKAGLEVLAIIAYRQPITRMEIDDVRGVNSSGALSTLTERSLITVVGRSQAVGNPLLYGTTREFLNHLGLKGLGQLPTLPDLEEVADDPERLRDFASTLGREVTDEDLAEYLEEPEVWDAADEDEEPVPLAAMEAAAESGTPEPVGGAGVEDVEEDDHT
jgi:segregation and condensation protein B